MNSTYNSVACAYLTRRGVRVTQAVQEALDKLFDPRADVDSGSLEHVTIMAGELAQKAVLISQSGVVPHVQAAPFLADALLDAGSSLCALFNGEYA